MSGSIKNLMKNFIKKMSFSKLNSVEKHVNMEKNDEATATLLVAAKERIKKFQ